MSETTLRQADNKVFIEGLLLEKEFITDKTKDGEEYIRGEVQIETGENESHTVKFFSKKFKKDGSENGVYKSLSTVANEYKTVADVGREEADKVRITNGEIRLNDYVGQDGMLRSFPEISSNFINRVQTVEEYKPRAEFDVEICVQSIMKEVKDEEETGRAIIKGVIPLYGGRVIPFEFIVADEGAVSYVENNYEAGSTVRIYGDVVNRKEVIITKVEGGFGKPKEDRKTITTREYLVTGGSEPYDEESPKVFNPEAIRKALAEREVYLEELKNKKNDQNSKSEVKTGFDTKATSKKADVNIDDLPF